MLVTTILFLFLFGLLPVNTVSAYVGPKPSLDFAFSQEFSGAPVTIISGILFECEKSDCQDALSLVMNIASFGIGWLLPV
jgi:hypothetical protein